MTKITQSIYGTTLSSVYCKYKNIIHAILILLEQIVYYNYLMKFLTLFKKDLAPWHQYA